MGTVSPQKSWGDGERAGVCDLAQQLCEGTSKIKQGPRTCRFEDTSAYSGVSVSPPPTPTPEGLSKSVSLASARAWHHQDWPQASWGALGEGEGWAAVHTGPQRWGFWQFAVGFWRIPDPPSGRAIPSDGCVASKSSCIVSILTHDSS